MMEAFSCLEHFISLCSMKKREIILGISNRGHLIQEIEYKSIGKMGDVRLPKISDCRKLLAPLGLKIKKEKGVTQQQ